MPACCFFAGVLNLNDRVQSSCGILNVHDRVYCFHGGIQPKMTLDGVNSRIIQDASMPPDHISATTTYAMLR
jgi:hypothetical protein